jgi:hypothetical protein
MIKLIERNTQEQMSSTLLQRPARLFTITGPKAHPFKTAAETEDYERPIQHDNGGGSMYNNDALTRDLHRSIITL